MPKFMFIYRDGEDHKEPSPDEMQQVIQMWTEWIQGGIEAGWMIDGGDALTPAGSIVNADLSVTDGPFAESKELVGGYSLVEANDLATAIEYAKSSPMPKAGGTVEVREVANFGKPE